MEIRLAGLEPESIVDGPGYRFTVFVQGCLHNCPAATTRRRTIFPAAISPTRTTLSRIWEKIRWCAG